MINIYVGINQEVNATEILSKNGVFLRELKGWKNAHIVRAAFNNKGIKIHASTIANVLDHGKQFRSDSLDALCAAFEVSAVELLNPLGFDKAGQPIGRNLSFPADALNFAINAVLNIAHKASITDREWIKETIQKVTCEYVQNGQQQAENVLYESLAYSGLNKNN